MSLFQALALGLVQGATEFIPVSSSAHLVLVPWLLGWTFEPGAAFVFDVLVQLGTLAALIAYFWRDLWGIARAVVSGLWQRQPLATAESRMGWLIALATLPAGVIGLALKSFFESVFGDPVGVAALLLGTAAILFFSERLGRRTRGEESLTALDAVVIGLAQAASILPGISRSGATIAGGLARGLDRPSAARFSFLMAAPVMAGAGAVAAKDLLAAPGFATQLPSLAVGFGAAAVVGYVCIRWLLGYLARKPLYEFAAYCAAAGVFCLIVALVRG